MVIVGTNSLKSLLKMHHKRDVLIIYESLVHIVPENITKKSILNIN